MTRRPLWSVVAALLAAAAALWGASRLTWGTELRRHPGTDGSTVVSTMGADVVALVPLAVLALAGVAAAVALGGWPRRVLGVVLALTGLATAGAGLLVSAPADTELFPWGRILAVGAGVLLVGAGAVLASLSDRLPRLGSGYTTPGATVRDEDADSGMWHALSQGKDPTTDDH